MVLVWGFIILLGLSSHGGQAYAAQAQPAANPTLFEQCNNPQYHDQALAIGGDKLEQYNMFCGPSRLSSESINLMRVNLSYTSRVVGELTRFCQQHKSSCTLPPSNNPNAFKNSQDPAIAQSYQEYQDDGLCLTTESKLEECLARWKRVRLDAEAQIARDVPKINAARVGMLGSKDQLVLGQDTKAAQKDITGGVLFDLYGKSRSTPPPVVAKNIDTNQVTAAHGNELLGNQAFNKVDDINVQDRWEAEQLGIGDQAQPGIEVEGQGQNQALTDAVAKAAPKISKKYDKDRQNTLMALQKTQQGTLFMGKISWEIFKKVMDGYDNSVNQSDPKKYADGLKNAPANASDNVTLTITAPITNEAVQRRIANDAAAATTAGPSASPTAGRPSTSTETQIQNGLQNLLSDPD